MSSIYSRVSPSNALLWAEFRTQFDVNGVRKTENMGRHPLAPRLLTLGDGTTAANFPSQLIGRHGISFDGGDRIDTTLVDVINYNTPFTFFTSGVVTYSTGGNTLIGGQDIATTRGFKVDTNLGTALRLIMSYDGTYLLGVSCPFTKNVYCSVAATHDGTGTAAGCELYINGIRQTKTTISDNLGGRSILSGRSIILGANRSGASTFLDHISSGSQIGNVVLATFCMSPQQVQCLHRQVMTRINAA